MDTKYIYVCGPTVYSDPHIGNMRPILVFDLYIRALRALGHKVVFIHNITDIDDKIIIKAKQEGVSEEVISERYLQGYNKLLLETNIEHPTHMPTVLKNMDLIILFIKKLVEANKAYIRNGNVYFSVRSTEGYGKLSNRKLEEMQYEEGTFKDDPADFVLWKNTTEGVKFDSPWGKGRPGWHTECVVFIEKYLKGKPLDIHGGGIDLLFPHHENENIQYKALYGNEIASDWRHVGHLNYHGEKMSKSIGNLISAKDFIKQYGKDTLRHIFMTTSYSSPIDLTEELINSSKEQVEKWSKLFKQIQLNFSTFSELNFDSQEIVQSISEWNFSKAMKKINELISDFNKDKNQISANNLFNVFRLLGFAFTKENISEETKKKYIEWEEARKDSNYELADKLREELKNVGIF